eukprot:186616-Rhodomonas_salina.2
MGLLPDIFGGPKPESVRRLEEEQRLAKQEADDAKRRKKELDHQLSEEKRRVKEEVCSSSPSYSIGLKT